jgi:carnitine O-acetyltransferase
MFTLSRTTQSQPKTLAHQHSLPRLPVPDLPETLSRYLQSLEPLLQEKFGNSAHVQKVKREAWASDFEQGLGRVLQERLVGVLSLLNAFAVPSGPIKDCISDVDRASPNNWLDDAFWARVAYLSWRVPLPINSDWLACQPSPDIFQCSH